MLKGDIGRSIEDDVCNQSGFSDSNKNTHFPVQMSNHVVDLTNCHMGSICMLDIKRELVFENGDILTVGGIEIDANDKGKESHQILRQTYGRWIIKTTRKKNSVAMNQKVL